MINTNIPAPSLTDICFSCFSLPPHQQKVLYCIPSWAEPSCQFCGKVDTLEHHFIECEQVRLFWKYVKRWFHNNFDFVIKFGPLDILLGIPSHGFNREIAQLNFIILFGKAFIRTCNLIKQPIDFYYFQIALKDRLILEKYKMATQNKKNYFNDMWRAVYENQ